MSKNSTIPDAWDDDWESQADKADALAEAQKVEEQAKVTKAQRAAKHAEENKKIWESAETPETFHFLAARDTVPFKTEFKPALKVLSRKPTPKVVARHDPVTGVSQMTIEDDDDEEEDKKDQPTPEELKLKSQRDREERERKYYEARARIMGTPTSGSVTPPNTTEEGRSNRSRGRGRGGRQENVRPSSQSGSKELFDPNYTAKPGGGVSIQKRNGTPSSSGKSTPRDEEQAVRSPKGPDGSGRGGFGFASRGGKTG